MKLFTKCKHCSKTIPLNFSVNDRGEIARNKGENIGIECNSCALKEQYHVNDIKAKESKWVAIIILLILVIGTVTIGYLLKDYLLRSQNPYNVLALVGLFLIPSVVYFLLHKQERESVKRFNLYLKQEQPYTKPYLL